MEILPQYVLKEIFDKRWFNHFFIKTGKGILEIRTAPIQPSADIKRETTPQGFFVAGRIWSNEYIDELGKLIESKIEILPADLYSNNKNTSSDTIIIERQLLEWNNNPLITLRAVSEYDIVKARVMESSNMEFIFSLIFVTVLIIILFYFIYHWISKPLLKLTRALETEDTNKIGSLKKSKSEFGLLANLIENFLSQKKELVKEIKEHVDTKQLLEHIASTSPALITVFDIDSQKNIYQNRSILSDLNYTEEEIKEITSHSNVPTLNLIHEDDNAIIEDFYNNLSTLRDDENREMEYRIKDKFGYWHWIRRIYSVFHRDKYGYPSQIVSVFENITNKKLAEEELKISEQYYRNLFESAHDAIIIFRPDNENILDVNEQACKLYGFTRDEMLKMSLQDVSEDVERGKGLIKETLERKCILNQTEL
jgi:PAS domain S-box-containing protein